MQVIADPIGRLAWISPPLPGARHDMGAAREHGIIDALATHEIPAAADTAYQRCPDDACRHPLPGSHPYLVPGEIMATTREVPMTTTPERPGGWPADDFVPTEELIRRQGIRPIVSVDDLAPAEDPFASDEEYADFLADLYATRRADIR